jgi:ATP-dependent exoDNAse (exonuclease V) beta subunit
MFEPIERPLKIYNASAGSGKTYTLVQEYLRIILNSKDVQKFRSILAMTFTNKAANEMKNRILDALIELSIPSHDKSADQSNFLDDTSKNLKIGPKIIEQRSKNILNKILHNYSSFSVMTIDKFTHKIVRTFAKDLGISMDFDVEMDINGLKKNVTDLLFENIGRNSEISALMLRYATDNLKDDKSWNFSKQLFEFTDLLFKEDAIKSIETLKKLTAADFKKVKDEIVKENKLIENKISVWGQEAADLIKSNGLESDDFHGKRNSVVGYFKKIAEWNFTIPSDRIGLASPTLVGYVENEKWGHTNSNNKTTADSLGGLLGQYFKQIEEALATDYARLALNKEILKNLNNLSLLNHLLKIVESVKEEENILLISDFYKKIADVIIKEPVPFIYERLGIRYSHFLLDEFQDTSHLQWVNMIPLIHNSLSSDNSPINLNLIVGDGKQAIYRWRNGDVEQFTKLPNAIQNPENIESLAEAEGQFKAMGEKIELEYNYRSAAEVVNFNNSIFSELSNHLSENLKYIYANNEQKVVKKHKGYIKAMFNKQLEPEDQLTYCEKSILSAIENGYDYQDICIIVRNNSKGSLIANHLTEKKINVISPDSLFIGKDSTVKFLYHLMQSIIQPKDNNFKIKTLEHYCTIEKLNPTKIINSIDLVETSIISYFGKEGKLIKKPDSFHNLYEFVESLIEVFDLDASENPYLQFYLELVHQFEVSNNSNIRDFLLWYDDKGRKKSIISPEGSNAVQIMTIHKSKGLQFPVVICPFVDWRFDVHKQISWVNDESMPLPAFFVNMNTTIKKSELSDIYLSEEGKYYLDQINLLYVAFTRPETVLYISGNTKSAGPGKDWLLPFFEKSDLFVVNDSVFEYGELVPIKNSINSTSQNFDFIYLKQKMNKPELSYKSGAEWDVDDIDVKRNFGTQVHKVLSKIKNTLDLEYVLNKMILKGEIEDDLGQEISQYILDLFKNEHFENYFNSENKVLNEKSIVDLKGHKLIPDKIISTTTQTVVVDFKTGQPSASHKKQLNKYINILRDMNFDNICGELFYTENQKVVRVN